MLPAQHRLRRSADFGATVRQGRRAAQSDIVLHLRRTEPPRDAAAHLVTAMTGPKVGLIVAKSVGTAVQRHSVSRRLRHAVRDMLSDLDPHDQLVIRALPGSAGATSAQLSKQLRTGLRRLREAGR